MRKIKFLLATMFAALFFTACGNKYSVENLKKNNNLLKETVHKCKIKIDEKKTSEYNIIFYSHFFLKNLNR